MKSRIKKLWLEALRSGEYEQGTKCLRNCDKYCCLGVLTDLYIKEHPNCEWHKVFTNDTSYFYKGESGVLHSDVMNWAGLETANPTETGGDRPFASLNDAWVNFLCIADRIEKGIPADDSKE
jgi:hypothetical protein